MEINFKDNEEEFCSLLCKIALEAVKYKTFENNISEEVFGKTVKEASECITDHPVFTVYYKEQYKRLKSEKRKEFLERMNEIIIKILELDQFERENRK